MDRVVRQGQDYWLHSCWGPPKLLEKRRDNPLLTANVLRAILWLRLNPGETMKTVEAGPTPMGNLACDEGQLLPSATSAIDFAKGKPGSGREVAACTLGRFLVVAPAALLVGSLVGIRPKASLAVAASAAISIELFVLSLALKKYRA